LVDVSSSLVRRSNTAASLPAASLRLLLSALSSLASFATDSPDGFTSVICPCAANAGVTHNAMIAINDMTKANFLFIAPKSRIVQFSECHTGWRLTARSFRSTSSVGEFDLVLDTETLLTDRLLASTTLPKPAMFFGLPRSVFGSMESPSLLGKVYPSTGPIHLRSNSVRGQESPILCRSVSGPG